MLDTAIKDGKNIFDFATVEKLQEFVDCAHSQGLKTVIAGSIRPRHLREALKVGSDFLGFRGAVCTRGEASQAKTETLHRELKRVWREI